MDLVDFSVVAERKSKPFSFMAQAHGLGRSLALLFSNVTSCCSMVPWANISLKLVSADSPGGTLGSVFSLFCDWSIA